MFALAFPKGTCDLSSYEDAALPTELYSYALKSDNDSMMEPCVPSGSSRDRTCNHTVKSRLLCQLSYTPMHQIR